MLKTLHVKNLALIEEEEIEFSSGLNILSGETGAGKSIILGALKLALGERAQKDILREADTEGLVEAVFSAEEPGVVNALKALDIDAEDGEVILSRRISGSSSKCRINGELYPASVLKNVGEVLLDIYGQKDHHSLLSKKNHLALVDDFAGDQIKNLLQQLKDAYGIYSKAKKELAEAQTDYNNRAREIALLEHEVAEIEAAALSVGEDEKLEENYRKLQSYTKLMGAAKNAYAATSDGASDAISRAISELKSVEGIDSTIDELYRTLLDAEGIIEDFNRGMSGYMSDSAFDEESFLLTESRLNEINRLKDKYGNTIEIILEEYDRRINRLNQLNDFDEYLRQLKSSLTKSEEQLRELCEEVSGIRKAAAIRLSASVKETMSSLNFLASEFEIRFEQLSDYSALGTDECEIYISTNPGESLKPLKDIASGGELSRIMLSIKTVMAAEGVIDTLIFDEIDSGISGKTALAVAECLKKVSKSHQVISITHLPQIAAAANTHFLIEKGVVGQSTVSAIRRLDYDGCIDEIARLLSGDEATEAVIATAKELKDKSK